MTPDIDINLLRAFLATADSGGFTPAARLLNRTQSAISMQIKRLEAITGGRLFERSARRVELTRRGEAFIGYARRMVALNDEALGKLRDETLGGVVRLGIIEDYAVRLLPPILARFLAAHPGVAIETETGFSSSLLERLGQKFDVVLGMHPVGNGRGKVVRRERPVWAESRQHSIHEQAVLPLALHSSGCLFRQAALAALDRVKRRWRLVYVCQSLGAIEAAAMAGFAVTVKRAETLPKGLVALGPDQGLPVLPSFEIAVHHAPRGKNRAAVVLADHLIESLRDGST